jgi:hypothetical protein
MTDARPSDSWLSLEEACNYTVGAASTCWIPDTGDAVFDSDQALKVSKELQHFVATKFDTLLDPNRSKGERIVAECLLYDEPFFVFRARDIFTPMVIKRYIQQLEEVGPDDPDMQASVVDFLNVIRKWQAENIRKVRYPD